LLDKLWRPDSIYWHEERHYENDRFLAGFSVRQCLCRSSAKRYEFWGSIENQLALEKAWNKAYKLGDTRALEGILDDQIVLINDDGSIQTKAEFLASVQPAKSQEQQVRARIDECACVRSYCCRNRSVPGQGSRSRKALRAARTLCRYLVNKGGKWVCIATNATPVLH